MDYHPEDSREDRLIEDYLFSGHMSHSKSRYDLEQQFAKPIQDEDLFGVELQSDITPDENQPWTGDDMVDNDWTDNANIASDLPKSYEIEDDILFGDDESADSDVSETDEIVQNPWNESEDEDIDNGSDDQIVQNEEHSHKSQEVDPIESTSPSPAKLRLARMKENFLKQARAIGLKAKKVGSDVGDEDRIEFIMEQGQSDSNSKLLFNKFFNKSKKAKDHTPEKRHISWVEQKKALRKGICAQKRKIWDSFQRPADIFDDEEEMMEQHEDDQQPEDDQQLEDDQEPKDNQESKDDQPSEDDEELEDDDQPEDNEEPKEDEQSEVYRQPVDDLTSDSD